MKERERRDNRQEEARRRILLLGERSRLFEMHAYDSMECPIEFVLIPLHSINIDITLV